MNLGCHVDSGRNLYVCHVESGQRGCGRILAVLGPSVFLGLESNLVPWGWVFGQ